MAFIWAASFFVEIGVNVSNSLPERAFLIAKHAAPSYERGEYVSFWHGKMERSIVKQIVGLPGDELVYEDDILFIETPSGTHTVGVVLQTDSKGQSLTPIPPQVIPKGYVFVATSHARSMDSRYAEMGLIRMDQLKPAVPLF